MYCLFQNHLIVASVTGLFRERGERHSLIRWFQRIFVIIPQYGGFCIVNEQLHVSSATSEQIKNAFKGSFLLSLYIIMFCFMIIFSVHRQLLLVQNHFYYYSHYIGNIVFNRLINYKNFLLNIIVIDYYFTIIAIFIIQGN